MNTALNKNKFTPVIRPEESIDENLENEESAEEPCPFCNGEGISYQQDIDDEEDKDFRTCKECGGSGIDPESQPTEGLNED